MSPKSYFTKFITSATLVSFSFFALQPAVAREQSLKRLLTGQVNLYNRAAAAYTQRDGGGGQAFVDTLGPGLPDQEKVDAIHLFQGLDQALPTARLVGENTVELTEGSQTLKVEVLSADSGSFLVDGKSFKFDRSLGLYKNAEALRDLLQQKDSRLWPKFFPSLIDEANAFGLLGWGLVAAAVILIGLVVFKVIKIPGLNTPIKVKVQQGSTPVPVTVTNQPGGAASATPPAAPSAPSDIQVDSHTSAQ